MPKIFAEIAGDGTILRISLIDRTHYPGWIEMSEEQVLATFEDMEPRYWDGKAVVQRTERKEIATYYHALGKFIQAFAQLEGTMSGVLREFAKVSSPVARAIFSGTRVDAARQAITRILDAENYDQKLKDALKDIFDQIGLITSARNDILHLGTQFEDGEQFVVTNASRAHLPSRITENVVSTKVLGQMMADLNKISLALVVKVIALTTPNEAAVIERTLAPILQSPWQYKPTRAVRG